MKEIILIKNGEIVLKGQNRTTFEDVLVKIIRRRLAGIGKVRITKAQSTICVAPEEEGYDMAEAIHRLTGIFGIRQFSPAALCQKELEDIIRTAREYTADCLRNAKTFKVEARRSDKKFPLTSPQIAAEVGGALLETFPHLKVDVKNPEVTVTVEVRDTSAFVHSRRIQGAGGMPVGTSGNGMLLISGGIDSPVAGYMMAKRGMRITAVHFESPPYTSERARTKVFSLLKKISFYCGTIDTYVVPFTEIQEKIRERCPEEYFTIIMRRLMMEISSRIAQQADCGALITGESLAQVASQTISAIGCTDCAADIPVFRPLIGMDKEEIIAIARRIDTFETSILPYEDCCTVFTPRHPKTRPVLEMVLKAEAPLEAAPLIEEAIAGTRRVHISWTDELPDLE